MKNKSLLVFAIISILIISIGYFLDKNKKSFSFKKNVANTPCECDSLKWIDKGVAMGSNRTLKFLYDEKIITDKDSISISRYDSAVFGKH